MNRNEGKLQTSVAVDLSLMDLSLMDLSQADLLSSSSDEDSTCRIASVHGGVGSASRRRWVSALQAVEAFRPSQATTAGPGPEEPVIAVRCGSQGRRPTAAAEHPATASAEGLRLTGWPSANPPARSGRWVARAAATSKARLSSRAADEPGQNGRELARETAPPRGSSAMATSCVADSEPQAGAGSRGRRPSRGSVASRSGGGAGSPGSGPC